MDVEFMSEVEFKNRWMTREDYNVERSQISCGKMVFFSFSFVSYW